MSNGSWSEIKGILLFRLEHQSFMCIFCLYTFPWSCDVSGCSFEPLLTLRPLSGGWLDFPFIICYSQ